MSNQSKYQVAIAAIDQYSAPLKAASASFDSLTEDVKAQSAEIKKLNANAASLKSYADIKRDLAETSTQMGTAKLKAEQLALSTKELGLQTKGYESAVVSSETKLQNLEAQMRATEHPSKALRLSIKEARKELKLNTSNLTEHQLQLSKTEAAYEKSRHEVSQLNKHYDAQRTKLHGLKSKLNESGIQAHKFGEAQRQIKRDITAANAALDKQKAKLKSVQAASAKIESNKMARSELGGEALDLAMKGAVLAVPIKFAVDFESAFADVKKAVNDASDEELEVMKKRIVIEAPKLGVTQEGLSAIIAEGARNGIKKDELFNFAESAAKMSVAFDMTADEAGASMMKWRTTMNLSQDQAVNLANAVNYVGDNMATTAKDITEVLVRQGAVITNAGLDEVQAASLSAAVLSGSASTEIAATATKNLLLSLTAGDSASGSQKDALMTLGFDPADLARDMQENAPKTVEQVLLAIKDQDADVQTALMKNLFGSESIGSIAPLLQNLENFRKAFKLVEQDTNFAGSMQKEFEVQSATAMRKISAFTASITGLFTVLGESMLPVVGNVLDTVTPAITWLTEAAQSAPGATAALMAIPAALVAVKGAALAFKTGKLLLGQGKNYADLSKAKLGVGLDGTAESAQKATSRLSRLNQTLDNLGNNGGRGRSRYQRDGASTTSRRKSRPKRARLSRRGGKFGRLLDLGSRLTDFLPMGGMAAPAPAPAFAASSNGSAKGKWGKRAAVLGGGTALSLLTSSANAADLALMGADAATVAGDVASSLPLKGMMAGIAGTAGKLFKPLNVMLQGAALTSAINNGSAEEIGGTAGDMAGGLGGAALGATIGTAILPGIGTVVGGALGGLAGGELGEWLGTKVAGLFSSDEEETLTAKAAKLNQEKEGLTQPTNLLQADALLNSSDGASSLAMLPEPTSVLPSPDSIAKSLSQTNQDNRKVEINLTIPPSSSNPQQDEDMLNRLVAKLKDMMMAEGMMGSGSLSIAMDGSLSDRSNV
ncbi:TPA: phage tail tape measure protein [Vibrio parahaemolyticus]|uniref:phage tail tape measure protein n=1 Tax=Vibrio parahaemolyticus TaxID=670 RepID=UPI00111D83C5|nr:phage tail tape measure protein [Vibrio parahaemolyticus]ELB2176286.1 phage tail tape measure protein [Vibrio parahaemolyticus]TOH40098.1 phage tail tape measure protein [Vibrio parahaemolyticus]UJX30689.1 phage tail tape measure protein [Vibrio parahaemolyticus]HCG6130682.1 phage tail tape measure protein [Vibrio parahaemolyticus]HCH0834755.1 phage tail tape measure protein [Vibrio parahaemolyticus]